MDMDQKQFPEVLELNVGGIHYTTSLITLVKGGNDMLSTMFSGRHNIMKDKDGRYFIDADGNLFAYILRYLRTGELPNEKLASQVYQEAKYFGLEELQRNIERMPVIMASQARLQFQDRLAGFEDAVEQILKVASCQQGIVSGEVISYSIIAIAKCLETEPSELYDPKHNCFKLTSLGHTKANVYIGPWSDAEDMALNKSVYLRALSRELEVRGFTVTCSEVGECSYQAVDDRSIFCPRTLYKMTFHWHKFT